MIDFNTLLIQNTSLFSGSITQRLFSCFMATNSVFFFSLLLAAPGYLITQLLDVQKPALTLSIAYALCFATLTGYAAYSWHFPVAQVFVGILCFGFILGVFYIARIAQSKNPKAILKDYCNQQLAPLWISLFVLFIFNLLVIHSRVVTTGGGGNNDIYYWAYNAGQFLDQVNMAHVLPFEVEWPSLPMIDAAGTSLILGLVAVFYHSSPLAVSSLFIVGILGWISLAMTELIMQFFPFKRRTALSIALIIICGAFFRYITYQYFQAQLCATFVFLVLLNSTIAMGIAKQPWSIISCAVRFSPLLILLTFVYQAAFIPFLGALLLYWFILTWQTTKGHLVSNVFKMGLAIGLGLAAGLVVFPALGPYLYSRMIESASAANGWPLAFLHVFYLFSLPLPHTLDRGQLNWNYYDQAGLLSVILGLVILVVLTKKSTKMLSTKHAELLRAATYCFTASVIIYISVFLIKGHVYQAWKLASYVVMPISFIPISVFVLWLSLQVKNSKNKSVAFLKTHQSLISIALIVSTTGYLLAAAYNSGGISKRGVIENLQNLSPQMGNAKTVLLDLPPFSDTMIAFNLWSLQRKLLPLSESYLPRANITPQNLSGNMTWATSANCATFLEQTENQTQLPDLKLEPPYALFKSDHIIGGYLFNSAEPFCLLGRQVTVLSNHQDKVELQLDLPSLPKNKRLQLALQLHTLSNMNKYISVKINGQQHMHVAIDDKGRITFTLKPNDLDTQPVTLSFRARTAGSNPLFDYMIMSLV
ncbi:MAG: hypothetical protein Q8R83_06370 [Legionellaceae bacterium]|nr:hypothetical protein [Legionellaceae bacterium]